jgi:phosphate-selective porin OprO/OprP
MDKTLRTTGAIVEGSGMREILRRPASLTAVILALAALISLPAASASEQKNKAEPQKEKKESSRGLRFVFNNNPSIRYGKVFRLDVRAKAQGDFRYFSPELSTKEGTFDLRRARIGVEGNFLKHFEYELEYEFADLLRPLVENEDGATSSGWRDAFVNFTYFKDFQIKAGKFKEPFSQDQLTPASQLDFVYRSRIGAILAPARDFGLEVHGRFFKRGLSYQAGIFERDGENARFGANTGAGRTFAGRLTGAPFRLLPVPDIVKTVEFGVALASSAVPEGPNGIRGQTVARKTFFPFPGDALFVHGERLRLGTELNWTSGPFSLKGEFIHLRDERLGQSLRQTDLPDSISRGWYLSGSWVVTGESKTSNLKPRRDFLRERGIGAVELAARYEQIRFGSSEHSVPPQRQLRAPNILATSDRAWTLGVNWYPNRWLKLQFNGIREKIEDVVRGPIPGANVLWTRVLRLQVVM